jgi:hypothetical protein
MAKIKAGFRAGDMVTITAEAEESEWTPAGRSGSGYAVANYHYTAADTAAWRANQIKAIAEAREAGEDTFSIAMDSAGESRLPPQGGYTKLFAGTAYRVLRARCRESFSYYNATGGWTKLLDLNTGREVYIDMTKLQKVEA